MPAEARRWTGLAVGAVFFVILLLLPAPEGLSAPGWRTAAVGVLMAVWWLTEALPIAATALVPLVLFPLLGVASMNAAASPYANPLIFLFLGGFLLALGMERWGLHRRLALNVIRKVGTRPRRIVAGFLIASALLSMGVSNTATAMMMLPIGLSVVALVRDEERPEEGRNFATALLLALAYGASIGGIGTLIGTPTNAVLAGFMSETYGYEVSFAHWLLLGLPLVVLGLGLVYVVLVRVAFPIRLREIPGGRMFIEQEINKLGAMNRGEKTVAVVFGATALLWIFRPLVDPYLPGLSDPGIAIAGALLLFVLPVGGGERALNWTWAERLPWGVLLLFGGGLSLAAAIASTGLATWIGAQLGGVAAWPVVLVLLLVTTVVVLLTELTSNTATAAAFLPVLAALAVGIGQNPLLLVVPAAIAASCAFMLPVATPPNAIVFGSGQVTIPQMARAGAWLNAAFVVLIALLMWLLLPFVFNVAFGEIPEWAR